jgi:hypothetical protein
MQLRRKEVAEAAEARQEELRRAAEQKLARHAAQTAVLSASKAAAQAKIRSRHETLEQQRRQAAERRCWTLSVTMHFCFAIEGHSALLS